MLNCSSNKAGDTITDGSVVWAVETLGVQFAQSSHTHDAVNISGILPIANGGTGATTAANARTNLGLATVASTGSYNDLSNKPTIPSAYTHPNSGVTAGTYDKVTVNAQGHVTGGSNPVKAYISTTYVSGNDWYRVWSDGWIEQGGYVAASNSNVTVTFKKPFKNTNYCLVGGHISAHTAPPNHDEVAVARSRTATNFSVKTAASAYAVGKCWYACGY